MGVSWRIRESNPRPRACWARALPTELIPHLPKIWYVTTCDSALMLSQTNFWLNRPNSASGEVVCIIYSNHLFWHLISWVWLSSPTQRPDSVVWQLTKKDHSCADRESNPGQMLGRHLCYHYTIGAVEGQDLILRPHASTVNRTRGLKIFSLALSQLSYRSWSNYTH